MKRIHFWESARFIRLLFLSFLLKLRNCDLIIEVRDARIPLSSANPLLDEVGINTFLFLVVVFTDWLDDWLVVWIFFHRPMCIKIAGNKPRLIVLNKMDLADPGKSDRCRRVACTKKESSHHSINTLITTYIYTGARIHVERYFSARWDKMMHTVKSETNCLVCCVSALCLLPQAPWLHLQPIDRWQKTEV